MSNKQQHQHHMKQPPKTWRELEAEGVKRCCAMFNDGTRCRRRAVVEWNHDWCAKHGPIIEIATAKL